jgi:hypothetical protein|tara:strand:+ start:458 stop:841 length:384 start_codon:yes stop_codon:yes gene_type:complete
VVVLEAKVVALVIHKDTLVHLEVVVVLVLALLGRALEIDSFRGQQANILEVILLCQIRDSLVEQVDLLAVSTMLVVVAVPVEQDMLEIQTHSPMEVLVDQVKRIHLLLLLLLHQRYLHQLEQDLQQM